MNIAVDAKWYHCGPAGVRTYIHNLVNTLHAVDTRNEYDVFLRPDDSLPDLEPSERGRVGQEANEAKQRIETAAAARRDELARAAREQVLASHSAKAA